MSVIYVLIPICILVAAGFLAAFIWAVRNGQYEDTATPSMRMLLDEPEKKSADKAKDLNRKPDQH